MEELKYLMPSLLLQGNHSRIIVIDFLACFLQCRLEGPALDCSANHKEIVTEDKCVSETFLQVQLGVGAASRNCGRNQQQDGKSSGKGKKICSFLVTLNRADLMYF